jgi:phenylalanyl-tRNA synthetase alpha chain
MSLNDDLKRLQADAQEELARLTGPEAVEAWRIKYLGAKGAIKTAMQRLKEVPADAKPAVGKAANDVKNALQPAFDAAVARFGARPAAPTGPLVDITLPGEQPRIGHLHVMTQTVNELCDIFGRMGFTVAYGPEVEDERHNFNALNIPLSHPARDEMDNFYINDLVMLRSQTSTVQIRVMENSAPPVRIIAPGRVYRPDTVDATHSFMFHQLEGLYVDEHVTMADLKTTLDQFSKAYFGHDVQVRLRPSFFPFTEPSAEIDVLFHLPGGKTRWIELGGCGMVDPNVLDAIGWDSEKYTGFAFGMGIERMAMRKHGITDIRLMYEGDVRFLRQF